MLQDQLNSKRSKAKSSYQKYIKLLTWQRGVLVDRAVEQHCHITILI